MALAAERSSQDFISIYCREGVKGKTNQHRPAVPAAADIRSISELTQTILTHGPREREAAAAAGRCRSDLCVCLSFCCDFVFFGLYSVLGLNRRCALNGLKEI